MQLFDANDNYSDAKDKGTPSTLKEVRKNDIQSW